MIPFLKRRMPDAIIIKRQAEGGAIEDAPEMDSSSNEGLTQAASDLIKAINAGDADMAAAALKAAFEICDSEPEEEGEDVGEEA